jgi:hypothetical protein
MRRRFCEIEKIRIALMHCGRAHWLSRSRKRSKVVDANVKNLYISLNPEATKDLASFTQSRLALPRRPANMDTKTLSGTVCTCRSAVSE